MADGDLMRGRPDIDLATLIANLYHMRGEWRPAQVARLCCVVAELRKLPLPPAYVDGLQDELFQLIGQTMPSEETVKVYLAFYGNSERAEFLKIGVAKNVRNRLGAFTTGNPMPNLWTYSAVIGSRSSAMSVESALLTHMAEDKAQGEWISVRGLSEAAALAVAQSLGEVASETRGKPIAFERVV